MNDECGAGLFIIGAFVVFIALIGLIGESGDVPAYRKPWPGLIWILWNKLIRK